MKRSILNTIIIIFVLLALFIFGIKNIIYDIKNRSFAQTVKISVSLKKSNNLSDINIYRISAKKKPGKIKLKNDLWIVKSYYFKEIWIAIPESLKEELIDIHIKTGNKDITVNKEMIFTNWEEVKVDKIKIFKNYNYNVFKIPKYVYSKEIFINLFKNVINWQGVFFIFFYSFFLHFFIVGSFFAVILIYINYFSKKYVYEKLYAVMAIVFINLFLLDLRSCYYTDWYNHFWLIGYFSEFIKSNLLPPLTINVNDVILSAEPIFYGYLFYPFMGLLSALIGPNLAIRFIVFFLYFIQYYFCWKLIFKLSRNRVVANFISIIITWSIYPLTNLYNRSAITEFVAILLAFISLCIFLLILLDKKEEKKKLYFFYFSLSFIFCLGTHPITSLYFTIFLFFILIIFLPDFIVLIKNFKNIFYIFISIFFIAISIFPWFYAVIVNKDLTINGIQNTFLFPGTIDSFFNRFSPLLMSIDKRVEDVGLKSTSTPYLDTQVIICIMFFLAGIFIFNFFNKKNNKKNIWMYISFSLTFLLFLLISSMSLSNSIFKFLPKIFTIIQFNYRLTTYINFSIFIMLVLFFYHFGIRIKNINIWLIILTSIYIISFCSVVIKNEHIYSIYNRPVKSKVDYVKKLIPDKNVYYNYPSKYYAEGVYTNSIIIRNITQKEKEEKYFKNIKFNINNKTFINPGMVSIDVDKTGWIETNISRFIWNKVYVDEKEIGLNNIRGFRKEDKNNILYIYLTEGKHTIRAFCLPPGLYSFMRIISIVLVLFSLLFILFYKIIFFVFRLNNKNLIRKYF